MKKAIAATATAALLAFSTCSLAADSDKPATQGTQGMHGMHGMQGMHGMMGGGCPMMGSGMMGAQMSSAAMPQLPPGNEKLQLQMWGEMMQKMGEIASKYAAQVKWEGRAIAVPCSRGASRVFVLASAIRLVRAERVSRASREEPQWRPPGRLRAPSRATPGPSSRPS
jgi:hypothetical protein